MINLIEDVMLSILLVIALILVGLYYALGLLMDGVDAMMSQLERLSDVIMAAQERRNR